MASYFNHSCECNATAVQADGSMEELTGADVLGLVEWEEVEKATKAKASTTTLTSLSNTTTPSTSTTTLSSLDQPNTPPPNVVESSPAETELNRQGEKEEEEEESVPELVADPYDSRIGEFRMMTFFATKDIPKGKPLSPSSWFALI